MKIDSQNTISGINLYQNDQLAKKTETGQQTVTAQGPQPDRVELTTRKDEIEKLGKAVNALPDVRSEMVAALKQQIADGSYQVKPMDVAAKMLQSLQGMNESGRSK